jgi:uncharacterized protein
MRAGDKARLGVLRLALAAIKQREVDTRQPIDDDAVIAVIERMLKQGRDALEQYRAGRRDDLVAKQTAEIDILEGYLPARLGDAELDALISEVVAATGATGPRDMGKVMAELKARASGRIDMRSANERVRSALGPG